MSTPTHTVRCTQPHPTTVDATQVPTHDRRMSRICTAMLTAVLAFLVTPAAQAAEDPVIPLLTGGKLTYTGEVRATHDWAYHGVGTVKGVEGYEAERRRAANLSFSSSWLVEGRYPDVPAATPMTGLLASEDYRVDVGSGSSTNRQRVWSKGTQVGSTDESCAFAITLDEPPMAAQLDETGRALELDPVIGREETPVSGCANEGTSDLFTSWANPLQQTYTFEPEIPRSTLATKPLLLTGRKAPGHCDLPGIVVEQCDYVLSGQGALELSCALCVDDIVYEHGDVPGYAWKPIGADGTFDGNRVRITAKVRNATKKAITAPVALRDMTHKKALTVEGLPASITVAPGQTVEVPVEWDSSGYAWEDGPSKATLEHEIAFLTPYGSGQKMLRVKPKPVIMVHGWNSDASTWSPYPGFLKAHSERWRSHAVATMDTNPEGTRSLFDNAAALAREVKAIRESEDADKVDIVAHSMGGLISRAYIDRSVGTARDGKPWVSHLVMLGTPNMGSPCADAIYLLWSGRPTLELQPGYVQRTFNPAVRNRKGVPFSILAGVILDRTCQESTPGDSVVALPSALWDVGDSATRVLAHTSMSGSSSAFEEFVLPRIAVGPGAAAPRSRSRGMTPRGRTGTGQAAATKTKTKVPTANQALGTRKLTLLPRAKTSVRFTAAPGDRLTALVVAPQDVTTQLVAPNGKVAMTVRAGSPEAQGGIRTLRPRKATRGRWTVRLTGGASRAKVGVVATVSGSKVKLSGSARRAKGRLAVTARFTRSGRAFGRARVVATIRGVRGKAVKLTLRRTKRGTYTATTKAKVPAGAAGVSVTAKAGTTKRMISFPAP